MEKFNIKVLFNKALANINFKFDENEIQSLIKQGLDVDMEDEYGMTLVERASFGSTNYEALFCFWKANAKPQTEYIEDIFNLFKSGLLPTDLYQKEIEKENAKLKNVKDISKSFSTKKLKVENATFCITDEIENEQDSELILTIRLEPFIFQEHYIETELEFICLCDNKMSKKIFDENGYDFSDEDSVSSSIYIQHLHNPVDIKKIKIKNSSKHYEIETQLYFDFEYEGTDYKNELVTWKFKAEK